MNQEGEQKPLEVFRKKMEQIFARGLQMGSASKHKIEAFREACAKLGVEIKVFPLPVESEINAQPFGFDETYAGARNRARNAQANNLEISAIGIENGVIPVGDKYIDLAVIVLFMPDGREIVGTSSGVEFPREAVEIARAKGFETTTAGSVISEKMGGIATDPQAFLTHGKISRKEILSAAIAETLSRALG